MFPVRRKTQLSEDVFDFDLEAPRIARKRQPGQFVIIRVAEGCERIPLTIADADPERGTIRLVVQRVGTSTRKLCDLSEGEAIRDVVGPLGKPTHIVNWGHCVSIGGGVGIAPIYPITRAAKEAGNRITSILGARTQDLLILVDQMAELSDEVIVITDDGSSGKQGLVTDALRELVERGEKIDMVLCIGPTIMMKFVALLTKQLNLPTLVSLNPIMIDGTGMCGGCRVQVGGETKFTCVDGPEFDGHLVDFDDLMKRQRMYFGQEQQSLKHYHEKCRLGA
jgi:ferredoxin--NADP+ reductase